MSDKPEKRKASSWRPSSSSRTEGDDDDDLPTTRTPAPSPYPYQNDDDEDDNEEEEEEEEDDENLLEILIETLTGTTFQVRVSPWETGAGLKALLQRTQGLPSTHQHILIGQTELVDDSPLIDQGVQEGTSLRLILAMKGGPINTRRVSAYDDSLWKEFSDYMEVNREELWDNDPGRPVTLLVLREGDAVNLYRVVENGDGTFSPLNESWSSNRSGSGKTDRSSDKESLLEETVKHQQKMAELNARMEELKLKREEKKKKPSSKPMSPRVKVSSGHRLRKARPSVSQIHKSKDNGDNDVVLTPKSNDFKTPEKSLRSPRTPEYSVKPQSRLSRLPPVISSAKPTSNRQSSRPVTQETPSDLRRISISRGSRLLDELPVKVQPKHVEFSYHPKLESIRNRERKGSLHTLKEHTGSAEHQNPKKRKPSLSNGGEYQKIDSSPNSAESERTRSRERTEAWSGRDVPYPLYIDSSNRKRKNRYKNRLNQSYSIEILHTPRDWEDRPKTSPEVLEHRPVSATTNSTMSEKINLRGPDDRLKELINILNNSRANSRLAESPPSHRVPPLRRGSKSRVQSKSKPGTSHLSSRTSLSTSFASVKGTSSPSPPFSPKGTDSLHGSHTQEQLALLKDLVKNQKSASTKSTPEKNKKIIRRPGSGQFKAIVTPKGPLGLSPRTPSKKTTKKLRPRCQECKKKIGLVNSYPCRCGHVFCAQHRYSETHTCTFDYKSTGKKLIELANPLVVPPKLPKI